MVSCIIEDEIGVNDVFRDEDELYSFTKFY